jgi:hypothetical protein
MAYYVKTAVWPDYAKGDILPDGLADEAMVASGAIEWREDAKPELYVSDKDKTAAKPSKSKAVK